MKKDGIFISIKNLCIISFVFTLCISMLAFIGFEQNIETLGTDKEWKFYASLAGFIICSSMLFVSFISLVILLVSKFKDKPYIARYIKKIENNNIE